MRFAPLLAVLAVSCVEVRPGYTREDVPWQPDPVPARVPPGNVRVTVDVWEFAEADAGAFGAVAAGFDAKAPVAVGVFLKDNGIAVRAGRRDFVAWFRAEAAKFRSQSFRSGTLLIAEGHEGSFSIVRREGEAIELEVPVYHGAVRVRTLRVLSEGSGFRVTPIPREGGQVDLRLSPWLMNPEGRETVLAEVETRLAVEPGRPYVFFEEAVREARLGAVLLGRRSAVAERRVVMAVTVEVAR